MVLILNDKLLSLKGVSYIIIFRSLSLHILSKDKKNCRHNNI